MYTINSSQSVTCQAHVVKVENSKVKAILRYKDGDEEREVKKVLDQENVPAWVSPGTWKVRMNGAMDKVFSAIPWNATVTAKSLGVVHKKDDEPSPVTKTGQFGAFSQFMISWKVVEGPYEGMEVVQFMSYDCYMPVSETVNGKPATIVAVKYNKSKPSKGYTQNFQLNEALEIWENPMKWSDNILPNLHKRLLKTAEEGKLVTLQIFEGNVAEIDKYQSGDAWSDEEEPEEKSEETPSPITEPNPEEHEVDEAEPSDDGEGDEIKWEAD